MVRSGTKPFPKSYRLVNASEFRQVFAAPERYSDNCFLVLARNNTKSTARLGLTISKKHLASSVQRNQVKRLVRECFRLHREELAEKDIVVLSRRQTSVKTNSELRKSLLAHWGKITKCSGS